MTEVAVVTGTSSGIGYGVASKYLEKGLKVIGLDLSKSTIYHDNYEHIAVDISDYEQVQRRINEKNLTQINHLVNCAGITLIGNIEETTPEQFDLQINVNLKGTFNVCKACIPLLKVTPGSSIVNISSDLGEKPAPQRAAYSAAKAGVIKLTEAIAIDYAPNVRANTIQPGIVDTPMVHSRFEENPSLREIYGSFYLLERIANSKEIVDAVMFLTSDKASFITGISLPVAGGSNLK